MQEESNFHSSVLSVSSVVNFLEFASNVPNEVALIKADFGERGVFVIR